MKKNSTVQTHGEVEQDFVDWFEKTDLGKNAPQGEYLTLESGGELKKVGRGRPAIGKKVNVTFPEEALNKLKTEAKKKSIGYQTLIRMIVVEYLGGRREKDVSQ